MKRSLYLPLMILSIIVLFVAGNHFAGNALRGARLDLTQSGLYRLSQGSQDIIDRLAEPVEWRFYYSRSIAADSPAIRSYATRVREFLRAYEERSGGRIRLIEIDPAPFSAEEDAALEYGLTALPTETGEQIFFGLVARNSVDEAAVIALFDPANEARLEYELSRTIADIERQQAPRLAILTSLPISPDDGAPNRFVSELAGRYELVWVERGFEEVPDASAMLVLHPWDLSETELYLVDQFAVIRGRMLVMLDPMAHMALRPGPDGLPPLDADRGSDLGALMVHWGVQWDRETVSMDRSLGLDVQVREADGRARTLAYPLWFSVPGSFMSADDLATSNLDLGVNFGSPGALFFDVESGFEITTLIATSPEGALLDADIAAGSPSPDELLRDYEPSPLPITLAARLEGVISTAFPEGPPASDLVFNPADHRDLAEAPGEIIVVADADWLDNGYYVRSDPSLGDYIVADNLNLALNLVDSAVGDRALISLRSRTPANRSMTTVDRLRSEAETEYFELQTQLETEIEEAQLRLQTLTRSGSASALASDAARSGQAEALALRRQISRTRERLREIEREFREDIDALDASLQFWTIGVPPAVVIFAGIAGAIFRRRRGRR